MAGLITVGGLATGLDTNSIISQLVALEQKPVDLLKQQAADVQSTRDAVGAVSARVGALRDAASALGFATNVLVRKATSSNADVLTATAGTGAQRGTTGVTVTQLARSSVAGATIGLASADALVATSEGRFKFQVGGGEVQSVNVDGTTTLQQLATSINNLGAGVSASAINLGTAANPDWRLQIATAATGASSTITVVQDDTNLAVQTTQAGQNAAFTVAGFTGTFQRESNTVGDVLPGVTFQLQELGSSTITVADDTEAITAKVKALATAFNGLAGFVNAQAGVTTNSDKSVSVGPLANESAVLRTVDRLHSALSAPYTAAAGRYVNLSSIGFATYVATSSDDPQRGTVTFDEKKFQAALADDPDAVAAVLAGDGSTTGIANGVRTLADQVTSIDGSLVSEDKALGQRITSLADQADQAQRRVDAFEARLQTQFAALESLVTQFKQQGDFLTSAFAKKA